MRVLGGVLAAAAAAACGSSKDAGEGGKASAPPPVAAGTSSDGGQPRAEPLRIAVGSCYDADVPIAGADLEAALGVDPLGLQGGDAAGGPGYHRQKAGVAPVRVPGTAGGTGGDAGPAPDAHPYTEGAEVAAALAAEADALRACFAVARAADASLHGAVLLTMTVDAGGAITSVEVGDDDAGAADCLAKLARGLDVPAAPNEPRRLMCGVAYGLVDESTARERARVVAITSESVSIDNVTTDDVPAALNEALGPPSAGGARPRFIVLRAAPDVSFARVHGVLGAARGAPYVVYDVRDGDEWTSLFVPEVPRPDDLLWSMGVGERATATLTLGDDGALEAQAIEPREADVYMPLELRVAPDVRWGDVADRLRAARDAGYPDVRWSLAEAK